MAAGGSTFHIDHYGIGSEVAVNEAERMEVMDCQYDLCCDESNILDRYDRWYRNSGAALFHAVQVFGQEQACLIPHGIIDEKEVVCGFYRPPQWQQEAVPQLPGLLFQTAVPLAVLISQCSYICAVATLPQMIEQYFLPHNSQQVHSLLAAVTNL
jgi:hypothetical protein